MMFKKYLLLTAVGAVLTVGVHKVLVQPKLPELALKDALHDVQADRPDNAEPLVQMVRFRPDADGPATPAITPVETAAVAPVATPMPQFAPDLTPAPELAVEHAEVVVFAPGDHPLGQIKPRHRATLLSRLAEIRPMPRASHDGVNRSVRPKARIANLAPPPQTYAAVAPTAPSVETAPSPAPVLAVATLTPGRTVGCSPQLTRAIPRRSGNAISGSQIVKKTMKLGGKQRDAYVASQLLAGNMPAFMRNLTAVSFDGTAGGKKVQVIICVTPDYLAAGNDTDFVRVPMGLPAAAKVADKFGFLLPTTKMVDAIYAQAGVKMAPSPMTPNNRMSSTSYLSEHNQTVERQRVALSRNSSLLTAGQKKDLVLSNRLRTSPGRVAIYGWHRRNGAPIQPLSTVHGALYADYSHGIRLVSATAYVNGRPVPLAKLLEDPKLAGIVSKEGPIKSPRHLMASLYTR